MRKMKLITPRNTLSGEVAFVQLLDSKFEPNNTVSVKLQALDVYGDNIGYEENFTGQITDPASLHASVNTLVAAHFGAVIEVI